MSIRIDTRVCNAVWKIATDGHLRMTSVILWTGDLWSKLVAGIRSRERAEVVFL